MSKKRPKTWVDRTGEVNKNKFGTEMKIIKYDNWYNTTVEFQDKYRFKRNVCYGDFKLGKVRNPYDKVIYGEGFFGGRRFN